jgi:hypothetical protein
MVRWSIRRKVSALNHFWRFTDDVFYQPLYKTGKYAKSH